MNKLLWGLFIGVLYVFYSFQEPKLKKRITDTTFRYEFYVTDKEANVREGRLYYWFKGGAIHQTEYGISGDLLDDSYDKFYLNNQLAEQGTFDKGLKVGLWKAWYLNGKIESIAYWDNGRRNGTYYQYDENGKLMHKGRYRADKKQGRWIDYVAKDTLLYKNDELVISRPKNKKRVKKDSLNGETKKPSFFKRLFSKKDKNNTSRNESIQDTNKNTLNKGKNSKTATDKKTVAKQTSKAKESKVSKKKGFFQKLFSKNEKADGKS